MSRPERSPERGRLYWGRLDKRRPVLVVSSDKFNTLLLYLDIAVEPLA